MLVRDLRTGRLVMLGGNAASTQLSAYAPPRFGAGPPAAAFHAPRLGYQSQWVRDERLGLPILAALPAIAAKVLPIVGSLLPMLTAKSESPPQAPQGSPGPTPQAQPAEKPSLLTTATTLLPQVASALTSLMPMPRAQTANAPMTGSPTEQTPIALTQPPPGAQSMGPSPTPGESIQSPGSPSQAAPVTTNTQTTDTSTEVVVAPMRVRQPDGRVAVVPVRVRRRRKRRRRVRVVRASPAYARAPGMGYAVPPTGFLRPPPYY